MLDALTAHAADTVLLDDGTRCWSAAELVAAVAAERRWLSSHGGGRCALLADNGSGWVLSDLALLAGATPSVPVPAYFTAAQLRHVLGDAAIDRVLTDQPERVVAASTDYSVLGTSPVTGLTLLASDRADATRPMPAGTAKVTYTSGSTGTPKGVCLGHEGLLTVARTLAAQAGPLGVRRHLCLLPLPTLLENLAGVHAPLLAGGTCIVPPLASVGMSYAGLDVPRLLQSITRHQPNSLILVPELLRALVTAAEAGWHPPASLTFLAVGGAAVPPELLRRAHAAGLPAFEGYGLTECTSVVTLNVPGASRTGTAGRVLPHARVRVDAHGEIIVGGALLLGYLGSAAQAGDEFATGDVGELDADGYLHVRGRRGNVIITSFGRNVAPEWVESVLLEERAIAQAFVTGEGRPSPIAVITPAAASITDGDIAAAIDRANASLPAYAAVRSWVRSAAPFTFRDGLLTANGRLRRSALRERFHKELSAL